MKYYGTQIEQVMMIIYDKIGANLLYLRHLRSGSNQTSA